MRHSTFYMVTEELEQLERDYSVLESYVNDQLNRGALSISEELDYMVELMKLEHRIDALKGRK